MKKWPKSVYEWIKMRRIDHPEYFTIEYDNTLYGFWFDQNTWDHKSKWCWQSLSSRVPPKAFGPAPAIIRDSTDILSLWSGRYADLTPRQLLIKIMNGYNQ